MQPQFQSVGPNNRQRRFAGAACVDHEHVARAQRLGQIAKCNVINRIIAYPRHHQPNLIPAEAACLGWLARLQFRDGRSKARESSFEFTMVMGDTVVGIELDITYPLNNQLSFVLNNSRAA